MPNLRVLDLSCNQIGADGVAALASALRGGAMPACTQIRLDDNQIGADGVAALASALRGGALPACEYIALDENPGADEDEDGDWTCPQVDEALASPERAAALARRRAE